MLHVVWFILRLFCDRIPFLSKRSLLLKLVMEKAHLNQGSLLLQREQLPDSCMRQGVFRCLTWSRWKEVLTFKLPADKKKNLFQKCRTQNGYTLKNWFDKSFHTPAIYEVAVQNSKEVLKRHKCVVYYRICIAGFTSRCNWSAFLFRDKTTRNKVNRALGQNCTVLVRRGDVSCLNDAAERAKMLEISKYVRDNFDYAWRNQRKTDGR